MEYIRTKYNVYEKEYIKHDELLNTYYYHDCVIGNIEIIKQANTIEELCDVYIIKGEFGIYTVSFKELDEHAMGQTKEMLLSGQLEAYGAIWIIDSDGAPTLKPVAKVNKEGRLELL